MKRSNASKINPEWTEEEVSILVEIWRDLETNPAVRRQNRKDVAGGLDAQIAVRFSQQSRTTRSTEALKGIRCRINQVIRLIRAFDTDQRALGGPSGGCLYFDLRKEERKQVKMNQRERATSHLLSQESFNKLMRLESVQKCTGPRKPKAPGRKTQAEPDNHRPLKRRAYWSVEEVRNLVHAWSQIMKRMKVSVGDFERKRFDKSAELYTPQDRSVASAWQKMKCIVISYEFIRDFNERHGSDQWFSGSAQDLRIDWGELPADFEDIGRDIFEEIHSVDCNLAATSISRIIPSNTSALRPPPDNEAQGISEDQPEDGNVHQGSSQLREAVDQCSEELHNESPHIREVNASSNKALTHKNQRDHQELITNQQGLNTLQERMLQLQNEQFQQAVDRLRVDVGRDLDRSTEMVTTILFDRFGQPGTDGDATFVSKLLKGHRERVGDHFARFQEEVSRNLSRKDY